jgi:hypothetical protein
MLRLEFQEKTKKNKDCYNLTQLIDDDKQEVLL